MAIKTEKRIKGCLFYRPDGRCDEMERRYADGNVMNEFFDERSFQCSFRRAMNDCPIGLKSDKNQKEAAQMLVKTQENR